MTRFNTHALDAELKRLRDVAGPSAAANALNRVRTKVLNPSLVRLAKTKGLPENKVKSRHDSSGRRKGSRTRYRKANFKRLVTDWDWTGRKRRAGAIPLIQVKPVQQTASGVTAGKTTVRSAFITSAKSSRKTVQKKRKRKTGTVFVSVVVGNSQVYKRVGKARKPIDVQRLDLEPEASQIMTQAVRASGPIWKREADIELKKMADKSNARRG